jgi:hypothetical protein
MFSFISALSSVVVPDTLIDLLNPNICYSQWRSVIFSKVFAESRGTGGGGRVVKMLTVEYVQSIPKRCIHIIIRNINLVYTFFLGHPVLRTSSSMTHNHKSQHGARVQQRKRN